MTYFVWDCIPERLEEFDTLAQAERYIEHRVSDTSITWYDDDFVVIRGDRCPFVLALGRWPIVNEPPDEQ
jgi:hypothetical protein